MTESITPRKGNKYKNVYFQIVAHVRFNIVNSFILRKSRGKKKFHSHTHFLGNYFKNTYHVTFFQESNMLFLYAE